MVVTSLNVFLTEGEQNSTQQVLMSNYEDPEGHIEHESREVGKKEGSRFLIHREVPGRTLDH